MARSSHSLVHPPCSQTGVAISAPVCKYLFAGLWHFANQFASLHKSLSWLSVFWCPKIWLFAFAAVFHLVHQYLYRNIFSVFVVFSYYMCVSITTQLHYYWFYVIIFMIYSCSYNWTNLCSPMWAFLFLYWHGSAWRWWMTIDNLLKTAMVGR